jgi:hypothetical protein
VDTSTFAAIASAVAATGSWFAAWQTVRIQGKSTDFGNCFEVHKQLGDAQRRVREAVDDDKKRAEFIELLNLLEVLALLFNKRKIAASTRQFTGKFLEESLAWIRIEPNMASLMRESMTSDDTYRELKKFEKRRLTPIRGLSHFYWLSRDTVR